MKTIHQTKPLCEPAQKTERLDESSPFLVEFFMVQGVGIRCMAYCGPDGKWRSAFNHQELAGSVRVLE